jgi:hypothetical protein
MPRIREADAERLLYVRRIVDEWIARIAMPKPATCKPHTKRVVAVRHQLGGHTSQEKGTRHGIILALRSSLAVGLALAVVGRARSYGWLQWSTESVMLSGDETIQDDGAFWYRRKHGGDDERFLRKPFLVGASAMTLVATSVSAEVVCNDEGDCWHVRGKADYKPELRLTFIPMIGDGLARNAIGGANTKATATGAAVPGLTSRSIGGGDDHG